MNAIRTCPACGYETLFQHCPIGHRLSSLAPQRQANERMIIKRRAARIEVIQKAKIARRDGANA